MSSSNAPPPLAGTTAGTFAAGNDSRITGAVQAGANSSITSLTGLTTPLTQGQGGTGATTLAAATMTPTGGTSASLASLLSGGTNLPGIMVNSSNIVFGNATADSTSAGTYSAELTNTAGNASSLAFNNNGVVAAKLSLNTSQKFSFGGWSWGADRWTVDSSGNTVQVGSVTATAVTITNSTGTSLLISGTATNSIVESTTSTNGAVFSGVYANNAILVNGTGAFAGSGIRVGSTCGTSEINANGVSPYGFLSSGNHTTADIGATSNAPIGISVTGSHSTAGIVSNTQIVDQSCSYATPTTGQTVTIGATTSGVDLNPAGTLAALTIAFPAAPINGQTFSITTTKLITSLTLSASQTIYGGITTLGIGGNAKYKYVSGGNYLVSVQ